VGYREFDYDYFYIVEKNDTVSQILNKTFRSSSQVALTERLQQIARLNPHIKDLNKIFPGTFIRLGINANSCFLQPPNATAMDELSQTYHSFSPEVRKLVHNQSELLNYFGYLLKYADHSLENGARLVEATKRGLPPGAIKMTIEEIKRLYIRLMIETFEVVQGDRILIGQRHQLRFMEQRLIRITIDDSGLRAYTKQLEELGRIGKVLKWGGRIVKGVDTFIDLKEIYDAPNVTLRDQAAMKVGMKSALGGASATGAAYLVCSLGFGLPSAGSSMFWCGALAGGTGAIAGGKVGELAAEKLYEFKFGMKFVHNLVELFSIPEAR